MSAHHDTGLVLAGPHAGQVFHFDQPTLLVPLPRQTNTLWGADLTVPETMPAAATQVAEYYKVCLGAEDRNGHLIERLFWWPADEPDPEASNIIGNLVNLALAKES